MKRAILLGLCLAAVVLLVPLAGLAGGAPVLAWSPSSNGSYDYGVVSPGQTASQTFTLTNSGGSATAVLSISLTGSTAFTSTADTCTATSLGPRKSCSVTVRYAPTTGGESDTATLIAASKKAGASVTLTGTSMSCTGPMGAVTVDGNLSAGPGCDLSNTIVNGNVVVLPGGSLTIAQGATSTIRGNVVSSNATTVEIAAGSIAGDVLIDGTSGLASVAFGSVGGDVEIKNGAAYLAVFEEIVGGNVLVHDNRDSPPGSVGAVNVSRNFVRGDVDEYNNTLTGFNFNFMQTLDNTVGGSMRIHDNSVTGPGAPQVERNTVTDILDCENNNPAPFGGGNSARLKEGQCANL